MRDHPIPSVTEPLQYRAVGIVRGKYIPECVDTFSRGLILDESGEKIDTVVLGRALSLVKRRLSLDMSHLWVVYPRCRNEENLHLQISGIWEPSTLGNTHQKNGNVEEIHSSSVNTILDEVKEGDDYFSIRGELIYTKPETKDLVVKIRQKPRNNGKKTFPFKLSLKGEIPLENLRNFLNLDVRRIGQKLYVENIEIISKETHKEDVFGR